MDTDWVWCFSVAQRVWRHVMLVVVVHFAWTFVRRVARRSAEAQVKLREGQRLAEVNNNNYVNSLLQDQCQARNATKCDRGTQWEEQPRRGAAVEGLTARKIKQLLTSASPPRSSDKRDSNPIKTANGHVSDLKMRFEDGDMRELKSFQRAVDNVKVVNRFATLSSSSEEVKVKGVEDHRTEQEVMNNVKSSGDSESVRDAESESDPAQVILRRKEPLQRLKLLDDFGGSVHSLEDIMRQQRFSRSLSQYSVSDLCFNESPSEINRDCQRFDELFSRSTEDLRGSMGLLATAKHVSMVDVLTL